VVAALLYVAGKLVSDWPAVRALASHWTLLDSGLSLLAALAAYPLLVFGWMTILRESRLFQKRFFWCYFRIWLVSYLYRYVPGKILLLTERARLGRHVGIEPVQGAYMAVLETVLVIVAAILFSIPVVQSAMEFRSAWSNAAVILVALLVAGSVGAKALLRLPRFRERLSSLAQVRLRPQSLAILLCIYLLFWLLMGLSFFFLVRMLEPVPVFSSPYIIGILALAYALGTVTLFAPGGVGVREFVLTIGLSSLMPEGTAAAIALASRIYLTLLELALAGIAVATIPLPERVET
jgi:hypothetical protein